MQDVIDFGTILKFVRKSRRITQEALADSCGLDRTYIGLLERGKRSPTMETLCKLSVGLDVLPSVLLRYWEDTLALKWRTQIHSLTGNTMAQTRTVVKTEMDQNQLVVQNQLVDRKRLDESQSQVEDSLFLHNLITRIDKIILLGLLKAKARKNNYEKSAVFDEIHSALSLVLADEALGLDAAQNKINVQSILAVVEDIYDHHYGDMRTDAISK